MECPRPRRSGRACWLRWTAPTRWRCRCPGSAAPARPVSERGVRRLARGPARAPGRAGRSRRARLGRRVRGPGGLDPARAGPVLGHRRRGHRRRRVRVARLRQDLADTTGGGRLLGSAAGGTGRGAGRCLPGVRGARGAGPGPGIAHQPHHGDCILDLYRSAVDVGRQWGPDFAAIPAPGLVIIPSEDPFLSAASATKAAVRADAKTVALDGFGHWWMLQDPARAATVLREFWATLA